VANSLRLEISDFTNIPAGFTDAAGKVK